IQAIRPERDRIPVDREEDSEAGTDEALGEPPRSREEIDHRRVPALLDKPGLSLPVGRAKIADLAPIAQRAWTAADVPAVRDEIHVERVPQVRRDEIGQDRLQPLVIEASEGKAELPVRADAREHPADVCIHREDLAVERVHHDAVRALATYLGERAEELLE